MVNMMTATRQFESNQRCIQALDTTLDRAVNDIARV
jgi:flagellar basal body rod protein FlgG